LVEGMRPKYNERGFYYVYIFKNGITIPVIIDDYFPCSVNGGPIFANSTCELWALLAEKAYAKVHGSYWALRTG
jgi:calpain-15